MAITPDTKDWTWVLDRTCPECGFDVREFPLEQIGSMIRDNADEWQRILAQPKASQRPAENVWSPLEYGCHVRDVFRLYDERLKMMLEADDPQYPNWDQDVTAVEQRYGDQDPGVVAEELAASAEALAGLFDQVEGSQWERTGRRSDGANFTVETFARYLVHDPIHHVWDAERGLARLDLAAGNPA